jgi:ABC-type sugar transport system ATPase subunit
VRITNAAMSSRPHDANEAAVSCAGVSHSGSCNACQLLAIARGLIAKPRILLLDEPSLALAPAMINELFDVLATLRADGVTTLLVDQMVADRGYVLEWGRIMRDDMAKALAHDPRIGGGLFRPRSRRVRAQAFRITEFYDS